MVDQLEEGLVGGSVVGRGGSKGDARGTQGGRTVLLWERARGCAEGRGVPAGWSAEGLPALEEILDRTVDLWYIISP